MEAKDLMVGDWVYCEGQPTPDNVIIQSIHEDGVWFQGKRFKGEASYDRIFPIPLTPKILEKNGFTSYGEAWYLPENKANGNEKILVGFYMYETRISVRSGSKCFDNSVPCEYRARAANRHVFVHDLQHALRLCGIDKEIEL